MSVVTTQFAGVALVGKAEQGHDLVPPLMEIFKYVPYLIF